MLKVSHRMFEIAFVVLSIGIILFGWHSSGDLINFISYCGEKEGFYAVSQCLFLQRRQERGDH